MTTHLTSICHAGGFVPGRKGKAMTNPFLVKHPFTLITIGASDNEAVG